MSGAQGGIDPAIWPRLAERAPFGVTVWRVESDDPRDLRLMYANASAGAEARAPMAERVGETVATLFEGYAPGVLPYDIPAAWQRVGRSGRGETLDAVPYASESYTVEYFRIHVVPLDDGLVASIYENVSDQVAARRELEQFADIASHDLQAPLRNVASFVDLLVKALGPELPDRPRRFVGHIRDGVAQMQGYLAGLLSYARAGRDLEPEAVPIGDVLADVRKALRRPLREADARIEVGDLPTVTVPRVALHRLLLNLVDNAIKYRGDRPLRLVVEAEPTPDAWRVTVRDNGIGVAPAQQQEVFEMFRRLHPPDVRGGGAGLGLAVCRRTVARWGGTIALRSTVGEGTAVSFTIPRSPRGPARG